MFQIPEAGLSGLSAADLAALEAEGIAAFDALGLTEDSDGDTIAEAERIAGAVRDVRAEQSARAQRAESAARLREEMAPPAVEAEAEQPAAEQVIETTATDVTDEPAEAPEPEPVAEVEDAPTQEEVAEVVAEAENITQDIPEAVAASGQTPTEKAARNTPAIILPDRPAPALIAAADVPGIAQGTKFDSIDSLVPAFMSRFKSYPSKPAPGTYLRHGAALVEYGDFALSQDNRDFRDDDALLDEASRQSRLPGGSLTAAGGWCAPSETLYDLCGEEAATDLLSLPEIQVTRGGIRYNKGPDFSDIFSHVGFHITETQAEAGTPDKTCYEVPCPTPEEVRCDAWGVCVRAPILTNAGYPELVRRVVQASLVAHLMKMNAGLLSGITTALGAKLTPANQSSTVSTLESLVWVAESLRTKYGFPESKVMEVVLPRWVKHSIREDLARRNGVDYVNVSDAMIREWFTVRNLAVQFVQGLDDLDVASALQVKPKASTTALIYPAGSFIRGGSSVISLDTVYDHAGLVKNMYTAIFAEECMLLANRCYGGAAVTIPICDSGQTGAAGLEACFGTAES